MQRHSAYTTGQPSYSTAGLPAELEILKLFASYDLLPSSYVYHATGNYQSTRKHLTRLRKGNYIGLPDLEPEEKLAYIPRNGFYVCELKPRGRALCALHGIPVKTRGNDHFLHMLLRSKLEYLLDHGSLDVISPEQILSHEKCPKSTRQSSYPFRIPPKPSLEPDITRGFRNGESALFIHVEVDRGSEPVRSQNNQRQNLKSKVQRYVRYMREREYRDHFGFTVAPSVVFFTTRTDTTHLKDLIEDEARKYLDRFYFVTVPQKPLPTHDLFAPWQGVTGALNLVEVLDVRRKEGGARERVSENDQGR